MTTPSSSDGPPDPDDAPTGDAPFLPPARPVAPAPTAAPADVPTLPSAGAPSLPSAPSLPTAPSLPPASSVPSAPSLPPASSVPSSRAPTANASPPVARSFDAKAMVESQKHYNADAAYGAMPVGTDETRAAARKLRENANRKRRRGKIAARVVALILLAGLAVGGFFVYQAIQDDPPLLDPPPESEGDGGATGATPSAGGLPDAVDEARDAVGQADPPVAAPTLMVADVFTPAVLDHTEVLGPVAGVERFVVRAADLAAIDPGAQAALVDRLLALPQAADGDERLAAAPIVPHGDIGIALERNGDEIVRIVAVSVDPVIRAVGP